MPSETAPVVVRNSRRLIEERPGMDVDVFLRMGNSRRWRR
jgi:hypothetical protein